MSNTTIKRMINEGYLLDKNHTSIEKLDGKIHVIRRDWTNRYKDFGAVYALSEIDLAIDKFNVLVNYDIESVNPDDVEELKFDAKFGGWKSCRNRNSKV